ncbi:DUF541 domain-containing protein [Acetobacteraceae bacterium]|nr:DUF541 domain-containing protein [Acetobacteraceae bacterium]
MSSYKKRYLSFSGLCALSAAVAFCSPLKSYATLSHSGNLEISKGTKETRLSFHTEAQLHVQPNLLILHLRAEHSASTPAKAQAELNQIISHALSSANQGHQNIASLEVQTDDYSVNQTGSESKSSAWSASQDILLKAPIRADKPKQAEELLHIGGELQKLGLSLNEIEWTLDEATKKATTDRAIHNALASVIPEAENAAKPLGLKFISLDSVSIDQPYFQGPAPRAMLMSASNRMAEKMPPQSSAHELKISATANVVAILGQTKH